MSSSIYLQFVCVVLLLLCCDQVMSYEAAILKMLQADSPETLLSPPYDITKPNTSTEVQVTPVIAKFISVNEEEEFLVLQLKLFVTWRDSRLSWNATEFGGLDFITVETSSLWIPGVTLQNSAKIFDDNEITPTSNFVYVSSDGSCVWEPRFERSESHCSLDVTWFPVDVQECSLHYQSLRHDEKVVRLKTSPGPNKVNLSGMMTNDLWEVTESDGNESTEEGTVRNFSRVTFTLKMSRKPRYYVVNILVPCFLLAFLTIIGFLLPPSSSDRLGFTVTVLLALTVYQLIVADSLPQTSDSTPVIAMVLLLIDVCCAIALTTTVLVMIVEIRCQTSYVRKMPNWMKTLVCKKLAYIVHLKPSTDNNMEPTDIEARRESEGGMNDARRNSCPSCNQVVSNVSPFERLLLENLADIKKLLAKREREETEKCVTAEKEADKAKDWILAAAVIDRIFFAIYLAIYSVAVVVFITLFSRT